MFFLAKFIKTFIKLLYPEKNSYRWHNQRSSIGPSTLTNEANDAIKKKVAAQILHRRKGVKSHSQCLPNSPTITIVTISEITSHQNMFRHPSLCQRERRADVSTLAGTARLPDRRHWAAIFWWAEPNCMTMLCKKQNFVHDSRATLLERFNQTVLGEIKERGAPERE